jgi:hypothetical protein
MALNRLAMGGSLGSICFKESNATVMVRPDEVERLQHCRAAGTGCGDRHGRRRRRGDPRWSDPFRHVEKVLGELPDLAQSIWRVLYDSACDDATA